MGIFEIGMRYNSYAEVMQDMDKYCIESKCKFWKRDARTIKAARSPSVLATKPIKASLVYQEVKFVCVYGGVQAVSKAILRNRVPRQKTGCPAFIRFKASGNGMNLILVAMNLSHNHELDEAVKIKQEKRTTSKDDVEENLKRICYGIGEDMKEDISDNEDIQDTCAVEYIEVHVDQEHDFSVNFTFKGLMAPTLSAFNNDATKSLNYDIIPKYAKYLNDSGIKGILVNGTSGEGPLLSVAERKLVTEAWVKAVESTGQHVMAQIGGAPFPDVLELARHAENIGVHSILTLPELYFKPTTAEHLISYLKTIGDAAPNTPILYYHIPAFSNVNINMGQFLNQVDGRIPNFVGIKYTSNDLPLGLEAVNAKGGKYAVFLGCDQMLAGAFLQGFNSAIATSLNMYPQYSIDILESIQNNDVKAARAKQEELNKIIGIVTKNGTWVSTMKEAMTLASPINCGPARDPLVSLTDAEIKQMAIELKAAKAL